MNKATNGSLVVVITELAKSLPMFFMALDIPLIPTKKLYRAAKIAST